jgi:hypothetical protein
MGGCVSPQIVRPQMDTDQFTGLVDDYSGTLVGHAKNPLIGPYTLTFYKNSETVGGLLRNENYLALFPAFRFSQNKFLTPYVSGYELEDLADPHPAPGHEFQQQAIPGVHCPKDDFIDDFFFQNLPLGDLGGPVQLS